MTVTDFLLDGQNSLWKDSAIGRRETEELDRSDDRRVTNEEASSVCRGCLFVCLLTAIGHAYTGSTPALVAFLQGQQIYLDRTRATLDGVRPGSEYDAPFTLQNLTRRPIRIVGLKTTCSCVVPKDYPRTIPPRARVVVSVKFRPKAPGGPFREEVQILTDAAPQPMIRLEVSGTTIPPATAPITPAEDQLEPIPAQPEAKGNAHA